VSTNEATGLLRRGGGDERREDLGDTGRVVNEETETTAGGGVRGASGTLGNGTLWTDGRAVTERSSGKAACSVPRGEDCRKRLRLFRRLTVTHAQRQHSMQPSAVAPKTARSCDSDRGRTDGFSTFPAAGAELGVLVLFEGLSVLVVGWMLVVVLAELVVTVDDGGGLGEGENSQRH
jgi:hypothetical protein